MNTPKSRFFVLLVPVLMIEGALTTGVWSNAVS
jgi:hypothetical protein